ncbi:c-type cytochrome [Polluticaenibacter yanchengensis]|uniref:C-type cytochrome n=1 Tax=Polluticaenibacter yanchengensis TaxID=3014562 RepID=A0ABT4UHY1_9BACT|nr:c-type cytochrome [Chitinophagaceae bacterium LY-5]
MNKRYSSKNLLITLLTLVICAFTQVHAQDGKALFNANCASCHKIDDDLTGPALRGMRERWGDDKLLHLWIKNWSAAVATGSEYAKKMSESRPAVMNTFGSLTDEQISAIIDYVETAPAKKAPEAGGSNAGAPVEKDDNNLLFAIITLTMAVLAIVMLTVNGSLRRLQEAKDGVPSKPILAIYKNKTYIGIFAVLCLVLFGFFLSKGAVDLGRQKGYMPEQPIFYSHKVHAGINQINCLYCHGGAEEGKHANIPSVNICMNCHMAINEYKGEQLYTAEGKEVNGTAEIQKLYAAAGFTHGQAWDPSKAKPIEWVKIHSLPDHVYFNHSQHVVAGKVQCQTCHGEIQKMDEVEQFADLSMGWCVNCHRTTKVQFYDSATGAGNKFYSIYEKFHEDLKSGKLDSVTVETIGGTDCQKCHY